MSVNKVILVGRLGDDPDIRYTPAGTCVANMSLATSEVYKKDGEKVEKTEWHKIVCFGKLAEICEKYLEKGKQVYFEGKLQTDKWTDKEDITRYSTKIVAFQMQMLGSRGDNKPGEQEQGRSAEEVAEEAKEALGGEEVEPDDVPF